MRSFAVRRAKNLQSLPKVFRISATGTPSADNRRREANRQTQQNKHRHGRKNAVVVTLSPALPPPP